MTLKENKAKDKNFDKNRYKNLKVNLENNNAVINAINYSDPDHIFHLAAESHVDRSINSPNAFIQSNINGTFNILEASRLHFEKLQYTEKRFQISTYKH